MKAFVSIAVFVFLALSLNAQTPDTYVATGVVSNISSPFSPAPFGAYGQLVTPSDAAMPIFVGMRYELYRDAKGQPAYGGMATAKIVPWHKGRFFLFGDSALGGAASTVSVSSILNLGGGAGVILGNPANPKWEVEVEPRAQRIPALQNGTSTGVLVGVSYTFNRPR